MKMIICPGIHPPTLTEAFLKGLQIDLTWQEWERSPPLIFPTQQYPAYSGWHIVQFLNDRLSLEFESPQQIPLIWLAFSAGVVGAIAAAHLWQQQGGHTRAFFALDGWGVPLGGNFPIHRLSHDHFTHWSSALLGQGADSFYADPAVGHLDLWRSPQTAIGWWMPACTASSARRISAARFLMALLLQYYPDSEP